MPDCKFFSLKNGTLSVNKVGYVRLDETIAFSEESIVVHVEGGRGKSGSLHAMRWDDEA
jgi:hypothetical protein